MEKVEISKLRCPRCKDKNLEDFGTKVVCPKCNHEFNKKSLISLDEDVILSNQEMKSMLDSFSSEDREKFLKNEFWEDSE